MKLKSKNKAKSKGHLLLKIGVLIICISSISLAYIIFNNFSGKEKEKNKISNFFNNSNSVNYAKAVKNEEDQEINDNYIAILEIPKISLKKGLNSISSKDNDENKNIKILKGTSFPEESKESHIFLASHSGNSKISYFKKIEKLSLGDKVYLYYSDNKFTYIVSDKYKIEKTGKMTLALYKENDIYLITCDKKDKNKQIVVVAKLQKNERMNKNE